MANVVKQVDVSKVVNVLQLAKEVELVKVL